MTQQKIGLSEFVVQQFYVRHPELNPKSPLYDEKSFNVLNQWYQHNLNGRPDTKDEGARFVYWLESPDVWNQFVAQVLVSGGKIGHHETPTFSAFFNAPVTVGEPEKADQVVPAPALEKEPAKEEADSDPIPGIALPHPLERFLIHAITALDPDAEIKARLIYAYIFDVGTSVVTALSASRGADPISVVVAVGINIAGSFAELIFRFSMTLFMHALQWRTKTAGDLVLLILFLCLNFGMIVGSAVLYIWNFTMTVNFLHVFAPARLVIFDFTLPFSIGAIAGVFLTGFMSVIQLEYVLRNVRKN